MSLPWDVLGFWLWAAMAPGVQDPPQNPPLPKGAIAQIGQVSSEFKARVLSIQLSADGNTLITGRTDGRVQLWDMKSGKSTVTLLDPSKEKAVGRVRDEKRAESVLFSPDGKTALAAGFGMGIRQWDLGTGESTWRVDEGWDPLALSPDGKTVAAVKGFDGRIVLWDVEARKERAILAGHKQGLSALVFAPDGKALVSASRDRTVRKWDLATGKEVWRHGEESTETAIGPTFPHGLTASADGKWVAVSYHGCWQLGLEVLAAETGKKSSEADLGHSDAILFLPGKNLVALQSQDDRIRLWDADAKKFKARSAGIHKGRMFGMSCSADGGRLVTAGDHGLVLVWDLATFETE